MMEAMKKVVKILEPGMRVPFIIAVDWYLVKFDFHSISVVLPVLLNLLPLLFLASCEEMLIIYGFFITIGLTILIVFSTIGAYLPWLQDMILTIDVKKIFLDALMFYPGMIFSVGIDNSSVNNFSLTYLIVLLAVITILLTQLNCGFIIGLWYFVACERLGIHKKLKQSFYEASALVKNFGYLTTMIYYYRKRRISFVLRLFWLFALTYNFLFQKKAKFSFLWFFICTGATTNTNLRVFALALWLPEISYYILWLTRAVLAWSLSHNVHELEPRDIGKALIFYFIASFNSVLDLDQIQRIFFITLMLFICFSYVMQSVHKLCDDTLMALSTSLHPSFLAHVRAILLTLLLVCTLLYSSWVFCSLFQFQIWQLVLVSINVVTTFQSLSSLAIYVLFMYDLKSSRVEQLDDWVYYLNATTKTLEFLSAFFLFGFGIWDVIQGSWSIFGLVVIVTHSYYNVWLTAQKGWKKFLSRRNAVKKLNSLDNATQHQLENLHDLCAICFDSMSSAKITQCGHYFHASCLQKWLYRQSTCPLCHQDVLLGSNKEY